MDIKPSVVVASATNKSPKDIIKLILNVDELPCSSEVDENIQAFPWYIDTKYYTADIKLCSIDKKSLGSEQFAETVEAIVICFDSNRDDGLKEAESWLTFLKDYEPEIQILLCEKCIENPVVGISKISAQEWCVKNGFELVELDPDKDPEWEEEQDFLETLGIARVVQALHAHIWPNLKMKDETLPVPSAVSSMLNGVHSSDAVPSVSQNFQNLHINNDQSSNAEDYDPHNIDDMVNQVQDGILRNDLSDIVSLYEQMSQLRQVVVNLPSEQRKAKAEQMMIAFWNSLVGDDEELEGLSDDGPEN